MSTTNSIENLGLAEKKSSLLNPKIVFNTKWDRDLGGVRVLELDAFKGANSNINNVYPGVYSPIDGSLPAAKTTPSLFFARTRLIKLIDVWNRILNSGLFTKMIWTDGTPVENFKLIGSNIRGIVSDYLFKNYTGSLGTNIDFNTENIFNRITRFLVAYINNYDWYVLNNISKRSLFTLTTAGTSKEFHTFINVNFNPTSERAINLLNELLDIYKELISETLLSEKLLCTFETLTFSTGEGRANILKLDTYKSDYKSLAKISDLSSLFATGGLLDFLNTESKTLIQEWIDKSSPNIKLLYPQFATTLTRNTESEPWSFRNVLVKTASLIGDPSLDRSTNDPLSEVFGDIYLTKYVACTQLDMKKPLVLGSSQFIDWSNVNDRPYIMTYNGGTIIYIPDEIKYEDLSRQPNFFEQLNPDYTTISGYTAAPVLPLHTYAMEFTFNISDTTFPATNYGRKIFGLGSSNNTYQDGFGVTVYTNGTYDVFWHAFGVATKLYTDGYKNKTGKIKIENTSTGSNFYLDDVLKFSSTTLYQFTAAWGYGCTDANRYAPGVTISNLKYFYKQTDLSRQPDNQINIAANFWKIGTSNNQDPNYDASADVKLKLPVGKNLRDIDKLDYLDNLTLYLKLN